MIQVTRLDGSQMFINEENIQWMESIPDTTITFLGGTRIIVKDTVDEVLRRIAAQSGFQLKPQVQMEAQQ